MKKKELKVWRAIYTKPRSEKKIAERLSVLGLDVYCPVRTTMRQWSDRKKKVSVPIFPSYVFLKILETETEMVLQDPGVLNFVYWLGKLAQIRNEEIENIQKFLHDYSDAAIQVINFERGEEAEIKAGPLRGQSGKIEEIRNSKASLIIESLGMIMKVEIHTAALDRPRAS